MPDCRDAVVATVAVTGAVAAVGAGVGAGVAAGVAAGAAARFVAVATGAEIVVVVFVADADADANANAVTIAVVVAVDALAVESGIDAEDAIDANVVVVAVGERIDNVCKTVYESRRSKFEGSSGNEIFYSCAALVGNWTDRGARLDIVYPPGS